MLQAEYLAPGKEAAFLVDRYAILHAPDTNEPLHDRFIPDGRAAIIYHFTGQFSIIHEGQTRLLPRFFYTRPVKSSLQICVTPPSDSMIVVCKASVFSKIFDVDMHSASGEEFGYFENPSLTNLHSEIFKAKRTRDRVQAFESALIELMQGHVYQPDATDKFYEAILHSKGIEPVSAICARYHLNPRTARRNFNKRVGIPPKELAEVVRVHYIWSRMIQNPGLDTFDAVCEGGFYDQPHFIRVFRKIVGETPYAFFHRNLEITRAISAKAK